METKEPKLSLKKINKTITSAIWRDISRRQRFARWEPKARANVTEAYYEPKTNRIWFVDDGGSVVNRFATIRRFVARVLGVDDVYSGNPGYYEKGQLIGHFVPGECIKLS